MRPARRPSSPGTVLLEDFMKPLGLTRAAVAKKLGVSTWVLRQILRGRRRLFAHEAVDLSRYFTTTPEFWLNLQHAYDRWPVAIVRR